jgi:hypothetical protein
VLAQGPVGSELRQVEMLDGLEGANGHGRSLPGWPRGANDKLASWQGRCLVGGK